SAARDACAIRGRRRLRLDLAAVTYADAAGLQLLRDLMAEGVGIAACSSFVGELLHLEPQSQDTAPASGVCAHRPRPTRLASAATCRGGDTPSCSRPEETAGASASRAPGFRLDEFLLQSGDLRCPSSVSWRSGFVRAAGASKLPCGSRFAFAPVWSRWKTG